jgi:hypothetical protein
MNLAVDLLFPDPPGNELGGLGTEIQNEDHLSDFHNFSVLKLAFLSYLPGNFDQAIR